MDRPADLAGYYGSRRAFLDGTLACRDSVLTPQDLHRLEAPLRRALAARIAAQAGEEALAAEYRTGLGAPWSAVADPSQNAFDGVTGAIVAHSDLVTLTPKAAERGALEALMAAGLDVPQVVALSELIAFANYEARARLGLAALQVAA